MEAASNLCIETRGFSPENPSSKMARRPFLMGFPGFRLPPPLLHYVPQRLRRPSNPCRASICNLPSSPVKKTVIEFRSLRLSKGRVKLPPPIRGLVLLGKKEYRSLSLSKGTLQKKAFFKQQTSDSELVFPLQDRGPRELP